MKTARTAVMTMVMAAMVAVGYGQTNKVQSNIVERVDLANTRIVDAYGYLTNYMASTNIDAAAKSEAARFAPAGIYNNPVARSRGAIVLDIVSHRRAAVSQEDLNDEPYSLLYASMAERIGGCLFNQEKEYKAAHEFLVKTVGEATGNSISANKADKLLSGEVPNTVKAIDAVSIIRTTNVQNKVTDRIKGRLGTSFADDPSFIVGKFQITYDPSVAMALPKVMQKSVRRSLRQQGKSFVTVNGTNPVEVALAPVFNALNAPMLDGLEVALIPYSISLTVPVDRSVSNEFATLKDQIWNGEMLPSGDTLNKIRFLLGTTNYNAWVKAYNGQP